MHRKAGSSAFTLVELMMATAVLVMMLGFIFAVINHTADIWRRSSDQIEAVQAARAAFEAMTRKLSQATLNTYYDYFDENGKSASQNAGNSSFVPVKYGRQSELHFVVGAGKSPSDESIPIVKMGDEQRPQVTHSVFFLAPLGGTNGTKYKDLDWLLKACGYAVVFTSDKSSSSLSGRPPFLDNTPISSRYRYCLMELEEPAESLRIYDPAATSSFDWFLDPLSQATPRARVLAENVVALVILPNEAEGDEAALCPDFEYNSRTQKLWTTEQPKSLNQLPPALKVVMIAIDEASARRLQGTSDQPPDLGFSYDSVFQKAANLDADIKTVEEAFAARNIRYHVFQTVIPLRSSRWSAD